MTWGAACRLAVRRPPPPSKPKWKRKQKAKLTDEERAVALYLLFELQLRVAREGFWLPPHLRPMLAKKIRSIMQ